jgi:type VI secretion system Hcp family effector
MLVLGLFAVAASPALAQSLTFLELSGIQGEATTVGFQNQIAISSVSFGIANPACSGGKSGSIPSEFIFTKATDRASVDLYQALHAHANLGLARFRVTRSIGGNQTTFTQYDFQDAILSSVSAAGTNADSRPLESWSLSFSQVTIVYTYYDAGGKNLGTEQMSITPSICIGN